MTKELPKEKIDELSVKILTHIRVIQNLNKGYIDQECCTEIVNFIATEIINVMLGDTKEISKRVAIQIMKVHDSIVMGDIEEAYHQLYILADPEFTKSNPFEWIEELSGIYSGDFAAKIHEYRSQQKTKRGINE